MSLAPRFFRWHRWLAWIVAIQVLAWVLGGLVFAWVPFQGWVKSADWVVKPQVALPPGWAAALVAAEGDAAPLAGVAAVATARGTALRLTPAGGGAPRWLGADGQPLPPPDAEAVAAFARGLYRGPGTLAGVEHLQRVPTRLGIVREAQAGPAGIWRARFDDRLGTRLYVDARGGELAAIRSDAWMVYDFFWRLHVMDYAEGEDFNNALLRGGSLLAIALTVTGIVLAVLAARRRLRRRG